MTAQYIAHPNPELRGNPLIEALGFPLSPREFISRCTKKPKFDIDLTSIPTEQHSYYVRSIIDNLANSYVVQDEAPRLYDTIYRMIERGYLNRNPLEYGDLKKLSMVQDLQISGTQELALRQSAAQSSFLLAGLSGRGKTAMVESILTTIPQTVKHTKYKEQDFIYEQVVWLKVDVPTTRGQRALLWRILESLDMVTGENYYNSHQKSNVTTLMMAVRKALIIHGVGIIVLDEAQNLSKPAKTEKVGNNENATLRFIEELFNKVGVPLLLVGTLSTLTLFSQEMTSARRIGKNGSLILEQCDVESSFWKRFIKQMCPISLLYNQQTDLDTLTRHIHHLSAGIPAIAASLIRSTMSYLTYLDGKNQDLSMAALNRVFNEQFNVISGAIKALKRGQYYQFEDCSPLSLLHENEDYFSTATIAEEVVTTEANKLRHNSVQKQPTLSDKQLEMLDKMSPASLLREAKKNG